MTESDDLLGMMGMGPLSNFRVRADKDIGAIVVEVRVGDGAPMKLVMVPQAAEQLAHALHECLLKLRREEE